LPLRTTTKDSTSVVIRETPFDTLLWIKNHKGKDQVFSNCDSLLSLLSKTGTLTTKSDGVKSTIIRTNKGIVFKCETDSLKEVIRLMKYEKRIDRIKEIIIEVPSKCTKEHSGWLDGFYKRGFWVCFLLLVAIGVIKWGRFKLPF
jgi:hypothetical protein